ncbi:GNAT family N-acetyltransferase [Marinomonas sp.]|nr:GNAT family N-acetyltransferase [Marinomonas sp.]MDB4837328.1 GNAT family N-acetyltransferase [Marinomonas sp.]
MKDISLRLATIEDATLLLAWRNDRETRQASHHQNVITLEDHLGWLKRSLAIPEQRQIWVAEMDGVAVGTCRVDCLDDLSENVWELSWTIAPEVRGKGMAHAMLSVFIESFEGALVAQVKKDNIASIKVAKKLGFVQKEEKGDVLFFNRRSEYEP